LHPNAEWCSNPRHATLKNMYNEYNCQAVYLDMLFSKELRETCDQCFMLVERGNSELIESENRFCSDINHRLYQLGDNTQKITFKHVLNTAQDKINKKSATIGLEKDSTAYLKILLKGKNVTENDIAAGDAQIKLRAKFFNTYTDMAVLSASGLSTPLNA